MEISKAMSMAVPAGMPAKPVTRAALVPMTGRPADTDGQSRPVEPAADAELPATAGSLQQPSSNLEFQVDEDSRRQVVRVVDSESGEVIRQLPSEAALRVSRQLAEQATGLIDDKA